MALATIEQALEALKAGKPVLVADDEGRENEGDAIIAAEFVNEKWMAWIVRNTTGYLCVPMEEARANELELPLMTTNNQDPHVTSYTISVDAANRTATGVSAAERANTANVLADPKSGPGDLMRPGHMVPLRAHPHGVKGRRGHTEAAVDLMKLAGLQPVAVIGEMVSADGSMMRLPELEVVGLREELPVITVEQIVRYLDENEIVNVHNPPTAFALKPRRTCQPPTETSGCAATTTPRPAPTTLPSSRATRRATTSWFACTRSALLAKPLVR